MLLKWFLFLNQLFPPRHSQIIQFEKSFLTYVAQTLPSPLRNFFSWLSKWNCTLFTIQHDDDTSKKISRVSFSFQFFCLASSFWIFTLAKKNQWDKKNLKIFLSRMNNSARLRWKIFFLLLLLLRRRPVTPSSSWPRPTCPTCARTPAGTKISTTTTCSDRRLQKKRREQNLPPSFSKVYGTVSYWKNFGTCPASQNKSLPGWFLLPLSLSGSKMLKFSKEEKLELQSSSSSSYSSHEGAFTL